MTRETWIDDTGDDLLRLLDIGRMISAAPRAFSGPRFVYEVAGDLLEVEPVIHNGTSVWKITILGSAAA
jgi:hypothetical protein